MSESKLKRKPEAVANSRSSEDSSVVASSISRVKTSKNMTLFIVVALLVLVVGGNMLWHRHTVMVKQQKDLAAQKQQSLASLRQFASEKDTEIAQTTDPQQKSNFYVAKAAILIQAGDAKAATAAYKEAYKLTPNSVDVLASLAAAYAAQKDKTDSITYYQKAITLIEADPNSPYESNLKYYKDVVSNLQKGDYSQPKEGGSWFGS